MSQPDARTDVETTGAVSVFERVLFYVLLAVVCARPMISESFERLELSFLPATEGTTPAATVWLDSLALTAAAAALARGWGRWRGMGWVLLGVAFLALAVGLAALAAGDKRLALNGGFSLLIGVMAGAALVQLMRAPWMKRLLVAAVLASGCATAIKCIAWKAYEHAGTVEYWEDYKATLKANGHDLNTPTIINFDRRLQSGEAIGYQSHPNTTGSFLMMWLLTAAGGLVGWLAVRGPQQEAERVAAIMLGAGLCALFAVGLVFTGSTGALAALGVGALLLLVLGVWRSGVARRAGRATIVLGVGYLAVIAATAGYGISRGTLPHPSLAFRWYYWSAAAEVVREAPLTGVGRLNFGDAYLRHKPAEGTEEVRDPHNVWVSLLVELGPLGLLAGVVLVAGCLRGVLRRLDCREEQAGEGAAISVGQMVAAAVSVLLLHAVFSSHIVGGATALIWVVECAGVWTLSFVLAARGLVTVMDTERGRGWLMAGIAAALLAALAHGLIDFALLTPGGLCLFVALAACVYAPPPRRTVGASATIVPAMVGTLLVVAHLGGITMPTMRTEFWLRQMKLGPYEAVLERGRQALASDPLDVGAARSVTALTLELSAGAPSADERLELLAAAEEFGEVALARNPHSKAAYVSLARIQEQIEDAALLAARPDDAIAAIERAATYWQAAVELYPTDPRARISAGRAWFGWWEETDDPDAAHAAAEHLAAALAINATRKPEEVMRLRPAELAEIDYHLRQLKQAGFGDAPATSPTSQPTP